MSLPYCFGGGRLFRAGNVLEDFLDLITGAGIIHYCLLQEIKIELTNNNIVDINPVQALMVFNLGDNRVTIGEMTLRNYYVGSNVSYNINKTVESGYVIAQRSSNDRRIIYVFLTEKGKELRQMLTTALAKRAEEFAKQVPEKNMQENIAFLQQLEKFLLKYVKY